MAAYSLTNLIGDEHSHETRESPVYALVVGKSGSKLKESTADEFSETMTGGRTTQIAFSKFTMEQLASQLSIGVGLDRPVLDKTGLRGSYDFKLNWTPDYGGAPAPDSNGVDIFTAIQEQLSAPPTVTRAACRYRMANQHD